MIVLYKDIFCFLPPYYVYLYAFLYKIFGNLIIAYYIIGLIIRWIEVCVVYSITRSFASKNVSFVCTFIGLVLQVSYMMDIPFDYNQMIQFYVIMGSFFCVKALVHEEEKFANIYLAVSGAWLGCGIKEEEQGMIFERFYRSESVSNEPGFGIGLYLVREVLSKQGGYVKIKSKIGKGTTVQLYLSRYEVPVKIYHRNLPTQPD